MMRFTVTVTATMTAKLKSYPMGISADTEGRNEMSGFEKELHAMFDDIWDCEIDHPLFQDTVGELMEAVIQAYEKHKPTLGTNLAEVGTDCISREQAIEALMRKA